MFVRDPNYISSSQFISFFLFWFLNLSEIWDATTGCVTNPTLMFWSRDLCSTSRWIAFDTPLIFRNDKGSHTRDAINSDRRWRNSQIFFFGVLLFFREAPKKLLQAKLNVWQIELKALTSSIHHTLNFTASSDYSHFVFVTWKTDLFFRRLLIYAEWGLEHVLTSLPDSTRLESHQQRNLFVFLFFLTCSCCCSACLRWATWSIFILGIIFNSLSSRFAIRQPQRNEWNGKLWNLFCKSFWMKSAQLVVLKSKARSDAGEKLNQQLKV